MYRLIRLIIPVVATTAAAAIVTTFFVTSATAAAAEGSLFVTTTTAGTATLLLRLRFVNDDFTAHYFAVVQVSNSLLCFAIVFHFHKTEALATAGNFVFYDLSGSDTAMLFKKVPKILVGHLP